MHGERGCSRQTGWDCTILGVQEFGVLLRSNRRQCEARGGRQFRPQHYAPKMTSRMNRIRSLTLAALFAAATACGQQDPDNVVTGPSNGVPTSFTQVFSGTLLPGGSSSYAFSLASSAPLRL